MLQEHEDKSFTFVPVKMWYQIRLFMKFENEYWDHFKGETWKREINVRDFIQMCIRDMSGAGACIESRILGLAYR